jgi:hypothetical protein
MSKTTDGENTLDDISQITFVAGTTVVHEQAIDGGTEYNFNFPLDAGNTGDLLTSTGGGSSAMTWTPASFGTGTVTSVNVTTPTFMTSSGGPITTTGTITLGLSGTPLPVANGGTGVTTSTGTGAVVRAANPTLAAPTLANPIISGIAAVSAEIQSSNTTASTSTTTGSFVTPGGAGIGGNLFVGGTINGTAALASLNTPGTIITTNATQSTSTSTGAIVASNATGGLGIGGNANIGGTLKTFNTTNATSSTTGSLQSSGGLGVAGNINAAGTITTTNAATSTSPTTGALVSTGGAGIGGNLFTGGFISSTSTADISSLGTGSIRGAGGLSIQKDTILGGKIYVNAANNTGVNQVRLQPSTSGSECSIGFFRDIGYSGVGAWSAGLNVNGAGSNAFSFASQLNAGNVMNLYADVGGNPHLFNKFDTSGIHTMFASPNYVIGSNTDILLGLGKSNTAGGMVFMIYRGYGGTGNSGSLISFSIAGYAPSGAFYQQGTASTSISTGTFICYGGASIQGALHTSGTINLADTVTISPTTNDQESSTTYYQQSTQTGNSWKIGQNLNNTTGINKFGIYSSTRAANVMEFNPTGAQTVKVTNGNLEIESGFGLTTNAGLDTFTYSTGTFTPVLAGSVTYISSTGKYVQTGSEVKVAIKVVFDVVTSGPDLQITNLPFSTDADGVGFGIIGQGGIPGVGSLIARGMAATTDLNFYNPSTEAAIVLDNTWPTVTIQGLVTYFT